MVDFRNLNTRTMSSVLLLMMLCLYRHFVTGQSSGDLRVVKDDKIAGRLEVYYSGEWGTVCNDEFDDNDAQVACKQLGNGSGTGKSIGNLVGAGTGKIWLDNVACSGTESSLSYCRHSEWGTHDCYHNEDVGIYCSLPRTENGNWGCWSGWTNCDVTCGRGTQYRTRSCNDQTSPTNGGRVCNGDSSEHAPCNVLSCPVNGGWSIWSNWTDCTTSCGQGLQTRIRNCTNPTTANGGNYCYGDPKEARLCYTVSCAVNGGWSIWSHWTDCTTSCGHGLQTRTRHCTNPNTANGGNYCYGDPKEARLCNTVSCAVNGGWSIWSNWTDCTTSCGQGLQTRIRHCTNPTTANGGNYCYGDPKEARLCYTVSCAVNGGWSIWSNWTDCTTSCGHGLQTRIRHCTNPTTANGGNCCYGDPKEARLCNIVSCAVNGGWSIWSNWTDCTTTCGQGLQTRIRHCDNPSAANGGNYCYGDPKEARLCNTVSCAVKGGWSIWSNWTDCTTSCGGGIQTRIRYCNNPPTENGGEYCYGNATDIRKCNIVSCEACEKYSLLEVVGLAAGCTTATICISLIGFCIYNKSTGNRKVSENYPVTQETWNEYVLQDMGNNDNSPKDKTEDDIYENTQDINEIVD